MNIIAVLFGGALGAVFRYWLSNAIQSTVLPDTTLHGFPLGTLTVNVMGSLLIGFSSTLSRLN